MTETQFVFVLNADETPLWPCHPAQARQLLQRGQAELVQTQPFSVVRLREQRQPDDQPPPILRLGITAGAKRVGLAVVLLGKNTSHLVFRGVIDVENRIKEKLRQRAMYRRGRRSGRKNPADGRPRTRYCRHCGRRYPAHGGETKCAACGGDVVKRRATRTRNSGRRGWYRPPRTRGVPWKLRPPSVYGNEKMRGELRKRGVEEQGWVGRKGFVPPSIRAKKDAVLRVVRVLMRYLPITEATVQIGQFDLQALVNPDITGAEYQQGPGAGYHNRKAALIWLYGRHEETKAGLVVHPRCVFCGREDVAVQVAHIQPRSRQGTLAWGNIVPACRECNERMGNRTPKEARMTFKIAPVRNPLEAAAFRYAAAASAGREYLLAGLRDLGLTVRITYGTYTAYFRKVLGWPKSYTADAAVVAAMTFSSGQPPRLPQGNPPAFFIKPLSGRPKQRFFATNYPLTTPLNNQFVRVGYTVKKRVQVYRGCALVSGKREPKALPIPLDRAYPAEVTSVIEVGNVVVGRYKGRHVQGRVTKILGSGRIGLAFPVWGERGPTWGEVGAIAAATARVLSTARVVFQTLPPHGTQEDGDV